MDWGVVVFTQAQHRGETLEFKPARADYAADLRFIHTLCAGRRLVHLVASSSADRLLNKQNRNNPDEVGNADLKERISPVTVAGVNVSSEAHHYSLARKCDEIAYLIERLFEQPSGILRAIVTGGYDYQ